MVLSAFVHVSVGTEATGNFQACSRLDCIDIPFSHQYFRDHDTDAINRSAESWSFQDGTVKFLSENFMIHGKCFCQCTGYGCLVVAVRLNTAIDIFFHWYRSFCFHIFIFCICCVRQKERLHIRSLPFHSSLCQASAFA